MNNLFIGIMIFKLISETKNQPLAEDSTWMENKVYKYEMQVLLIMKTTKSLFNRELTLHFSENSVNIRQEAPAKRYRQPDWWLFSFQKKAE